MVVRSAFAALLIGVAAGAESIPVRLPEGPARGFVELTSEDGQPIAHGELEQWMRGSTVMSRLAFWFEDGSVYDQVVRFSQRRVFRVESYRLVQRGPSFTESTHVAFDRTGRYRVRRRAAPGEAEEAAAGQVALPADVMNGMTSVVCKNLMPTRTATVHIVAFNPEPLVMELHVAPEGVDQFRVGALARSATRFRVQPEVGGVMGALATIAGKQPPALRMWMANGQVPTLVRFLGPLYPDGPVWRVQPTGLRWER